MSMDNQICETCKWWGNSCGGTKRECRRRPPVVVATARVHKPCGPSDSGIRTEWPMVGPAAYCGEWEGRDDGGPDLRTIADTPPMPKCKPPKEPEPPTTVDHKETCVDRNCEGCGNPKEPKEPELDRMPDISMFGPFARWLMRRRKQ